METRKYQWERRYESFERAKMQMQLFLITLPVVTRFIRMGWILWFFLWDNATNCGLDTLPLFLEHNLCYLGDYRLHRFVMTSNMNFYNISGFESWNEE